MQIQVVCLVTCAHACMCKYNMIVYLHKVSKRCTPIVQSYARYSMVVHRLPIKNLKIVSHIALFGRGVHVR